jgi:drug/metabolite transporter (DMT)-like permease
MNKEVALNSLWMVVAAFFFAVMGVCVQLAAAKYTSSELVFYRSLFGFIAIALFVLPQRKPLSTPHIRLHISRSINGFIALMLFFYALTHLSLATAITLNYTSPIFLAVFATFTLHERIKPALFASILLGFVGVILLLQPSLHWQALVANGQGLVSGLLSGYVFVQITQLGRMEEPEWRTVFYFSLICTVGAACWVVAAPVHSVTFADLPLLLGLGVSATIAQLAMTRAYRKGSYMAVGGLAYFTVVFASLLDVYLWHIHLSMQNWLAIILIVCGGLLGVWLTANKSGFLRSNSAPPYEETS